MTELPIITTEQALAFVREHGVVLESAAGTVPSLASAIAGATIKGNWWSHPQGKAIFTLTRAVRQADEVLVCRLLDGKITLVHRDLWPALVRASAHIGIARLARLTEQHTEKGRHLVSEQAFPDWVPPEVHALAKAMTLAQAQAKLCHS